MNARCKGVLVQLLAYGLALLATQGSAIAQGVPCGSIATPDPPLWLYSTGSMNLAQDKDGNVTGDTIGVILECSNNYYVSSGQANGNGKFTVQFREDGSNSGCYDTLFFQLTVSGPGCARASGTFSAYFNGNEEVKNALISPWQMGDGSGEGVLPASETEFFDSWYVNYPALALFDIDINPTSYNFSGRQVTETFPNGGTDGCWYSGSARPEWTPSGVTAYVTINPNGNGIISGYADKVGVNDITWVDYYRRHGRAPCALTTQQMISIDTYSGSEQFQENDMEIAVGTNTLTVQRGALVESRPLESPWVVAIIATIPVALASLSQ